MSHNKGMKNDTITLTRIAEIQEQLDELGMANGFWAGELSMLGCATLFALDIDDEDIVALADALWDDYTETDLVALAAALADRPADPESFEFEDLEQVADRFGADVDVLVAGHSQMSCPYYH